MIVAAARPSVTRRVGVSVSLGVFGTVSLWRAGPMVSKWTAGPCRGRVTAVSEPARGGTDEMLDDLFARGLVQDHTDLDALRDRLAEGPIAVYGGFDPSAESLHVGNLVPLLLLR